MDRETFGRSDFARLNAQFEQRKLSEAEWLSSAKAGLMLACLPATTSRRKLRLFACTSVIQVRHLVTEHHALRALEAAEMFADGIVAHEELCTAHRVVLDAYSADFEARNPRSSEDWESIEIREVMARGAAADVAAPEPPAALSILAAAGLSEAYWNAHTSAQIAACDANFEARRAAALRDLTGNPFVRPLLEHCWLTSNVKSVAAEIYDQRAFHRMPELATLLVSAGCSDRSIIEHCRSGNEHFRGCWVIDMLTGRD